MSDLKVYCGGGTVDQWGTFKRNKRDIIVTIKYDNTPYELIDNLKGFYNKALVYKDLWNSGHLILVSYNTVVAECIGNKYILHGYYSQTTAKHISAFLANIGAQMLSKREILEQEGTWQKIK